MTELKNKITTVDEYLSFLGINEFESNKEFLDTIRKNHGFKEKQAIDDACDGSGKIYSVKNKNLELSLTFAGFSYGVYKQFLEWLLTYGDLDNKMILDFGCDNGIIACFLGLIYPNSKIIGIDKNARGISCAKNLAKKLNLKNVKFEEADGKKIDKVYKKQKFDVIISCRSILEMIQLPQQTKYAWTLEERVNLLAIPNSVVKVLKNIRKIMSPEGKLITFERLGLFEKTLNFIKCMHDSELYFEEDNMLFLQFHEIGEYQQMPILIFNKKKKDEIEFDKFLDLYCNATIINKQIDLESRENFYKEVNFNKAKNKKLIYGVQMDSEIVCNQREELWEIEGELLFYKANSLGYLEIETEGVTMDKIDEMKNGLKSMELAGVKITEYDTLEKRDSIK